jgi:glucose/arabinose dehydrogenase
VIGLALHPEFDTNHKLYVHYNWRFEDGTREARVAEYVLDAKKDPRGYKVRSERIVFRIPQTHDNHNGGDLVFGPDGFLYIGIGDGEEGKWTIGRSPANTYRGKVLRIDVDNKDDGKEYAIPADNPFVGDDEFPARNVGLGLPQPVAHVVHAERRSRRRRDR